MTDAEPVLVVEDEAPQRDALTRYLTKAGFAVRAVGTGEAAIELLQQHTFTALITDLRLPGIDGIELARRAKARDAELGILLITAYSSIETAIEALRAGVHDYILKPLFYEELVRKLRSLIRHRDLVRENDRLRAAVHGHDEHEIVGQSRPMLDVIEWVKRAAASAATVLITGETGTGKEVVARAIHRLGRHRDEPVLAINVAALPDSMVESELFGHEKGAFTGAERKRPGILRAASSGTVFLDEIGELSPGVQAKLLRALEAREVLPVGADAAVPFRARILCATHRNLLERVRAGQFREDLYYRVNVLHIAIPPLRERREDIPLLARHLLGRLARRSGRGVPALAGDVEHALSAYGWPGNVRELSNVLERALILSDGEPITAAHLHLQGEQAGTTPETSTGELYAAVEAFERQHIARALSECDGNREEAAVALGLSPATLYRKLDKLGLKGFAVRERRSDDGG